MIYVQDIKGLYGFCCCCYFILIPIFSLYIDCNRGGNLSIWIIQYFSFTNAMARFLIKGA